MSQKLCGILLIELCQTTELIGGQSMITNIFPAKFWLNYYRIVRITDLPLAISAGLKFLLNQWPYTRNKFQITRMKNSLSVIFWICCTLWWLKKRERESLIDLVEFLSFFFLWQIKIDTRNKHSKFCRSDSRHKVVFLLLNQEALNTYSQF